MRLLKTAIRELTAKYRDVLMKCFAIAFSMTFAGVSTQVQAGTGTVIDSYNGTISAKTGNTVGSYSTAMGIQPLLLVSFQPPWVSVQKQKVLPQPLRAIWQLRLAIIQPLWVEVQEPMVKILLLSAIKQKPGQAVIPQTVIKLPLVLG